MCSCLLLAFKDFRATFRMSEARNRKDIGIGLLSKISKFADDTKIGNRADMETQRNAIQNDLDKVGRYLANDF